jgi:hypothetical protein
MSILVACVGEEIDTIFVAVREFNIEKAILIKHDDKKIKSVLPEFEKFKIPVELIDAGGNNIWEDTFRIVHSIKKANEEKDILINVSTGDKISRCAMTSAAFVNGLKAFSTYDGVISMLPVLKFSYYKLITDRKMRILETLFNVPDCCASLEQLSKECKMSLPLVSYHINGNPKSEGLKTMGLVDTKEIKGRIEVMLSLMGKILMKGYVDQPPEK